MIPCLLLLAILLSAHRRSFPPLYGLNPRMTATISAGISLQRPLMTLSSSIELAAKGKYAL